MSNSSDTGLKRAFSLDLWAQAAHDLRQPIQSLLLLTQVMADTQDQLKRQQTARTMEDALVRLQAMLDELVGLGRLEAELDGQKMAPCSLSDIAATAVREVAAAAAERTVSIVCTIAPVAVTSHARLLEKVVAALVLNALHFGIGQDIRIDYRPAGDAHRIEIAFEGSPVSTPQQRLAFIELRSLDGQSPMRIVPGLGFIRQLSGLIGCAIECATLSKQRQRLCLVLPSRGSVNEPI